MTTPTIIDGLLIYEDAGTWRYRPADWPAAVPYSTSHATREDAILACTEWIAITAPDEPGDDTAGVREACPDPLVSVRRGWLGLGDDDDTGTKPLPPAGCVVYSNDAHHPAAHWYYDLDDDDNDNDGDD